MTAYILWLAALMVVLATELRPAKIIFTIAAFAFLTAIFLVAAGDIERATLLALILALTLVGASAVKHHHSGMKLAVADLGLTFAGTIPFMLKQYRATAIKTITGAVVLIVAAGAVIGFAAGPPIPLLTRIAILAVVSACLAVAFLTSGGGDHFRLEVTRRNRFFSFFMASLVDVASWWPTAGLRMLDVGDKPLPLAAPRPARSTVRPDIIVIQHESVFDPRLYGLPIDDRVAQLLTPVNGHSGRLHVDIYGGGSWQTEFSLLTGLSSASFGPDSYFLFKKGVGRFTHSLPSELSALGYRTMLSTSCRRNFMNYDAFYAGIGVDDRVFSDEFPAPFDLASFEINNSDRAFFAATLGAWERALARDPTPRFMMALTNFNHGPHESRLVAPGEYEAERRSAMAALDDPNFGEYYARLCETADSYAAFKASLGASGRPTLIVRYGDHQPTMTRAIEQAHRIRSDDPRQFETFFALEAINFEADFSALPDRLDIAMLGTIALKASGLPLDAVTATRLQLLPEIGDRYIASPSENKRRLHRTLVDAGLIELGPTPAALPIAAERA